MLSEEPGATDPSSEGVRGAEPLPASERASVQGVEPAREAGGGRPGGLARRWSARAIALTAGGISAALFLFFFGFSYVKYSRLIDQRLTAGPFADTVDIFSAPPVVAVGDETTRDAFVARLRKNGYTTARGNPLGWYNVRVDAVEVFPGLNAHTANEAGVLHFADGKIQRIVSLQDHTERKRLQLAPQLIANVSENREKRRLVRFSDIPKSLVHAVISAEDKRFFQHSGFDFFRILKAAYVDLREGRKEQGASTLSMQLARGLWLNQDKNWRRKLHELGIAIQLEHRLTKEQIFEYYANQIYLGRRGTFSINGFGEAARSFLGKDLRQIDAAEAALLAGMVQRPSYYNPYRYPERAKRRRNLVLEQMRANGYLSAGEYSRAAAGPIRLAGEHAESFGNQYFLDLMNTEIQGKLDDDQGHTRYVYTTLDSELQQAAERAVAAGMEQVDKQLRRKKNAAAIPVGQPQVALVALDPRTGEVKALVGGRSYGQSQLNHVTAMRQPGSIFKPFVYAAALSTAVEGGGREIFTAATVLNDEPTSFFFGRQVYTPGNFGHSFMGDVTLRTALARSLNVSTVELAERVGYSKVVAIARRAGLNAGIQPTPSVALGAYETTPLEMAGAYTVFANGGRYVAPTTISLVRTRDGSVLYQPQPEPRKALDPRVNHLMVSLMQQVLNSGTGAGVRGRGFALPAAGKTGTSRDGWFAGFTSELLCVVWVGFDDNRDLRLEGSRSALPIWAEFMKGAAEMRQYRDARPFRGPAGIVSEEICAETGKLASAFCPRTFAEFFIDGTEPVVGCDLHGDSRHFADRVVESSPMPVALQPERR